MRESFKLSEGHQNDDTSQAPERSLLPHEYSAQISHIITREKNMGHQLGAYGRRVLAGFLAMTAFAIGEGAMREAHGQAGQKSRSAVEDVYKRYSGAVSDVSDRYLKEGEEAYQRKSKEVDKYRQQREIKVDLPNANVHIRQGFGGKKSGAESWRIESGNVESNQEQIDELAIRTLQILHGVSDRGQARHLIKEFADRINQDVGDAAEVLSATIPILISRLNNQPDGVFDSKQFDAFMGSLKAHPGIQEALDSARSKIAPRPKGAPPR